MYNNFFNNNDDRVIIAMFFFIKINFCKPSCVHVVGIAVR